MPEMKNSDSLFTLVNSIIVQIRLHREFSNVRTDRGSSVAGRESSQTFHLHEELESKAMGGVWVIGGDETYNPFKLL